jgi:hypothetical protein
MAAFLQARANCAEPVHLRFAVQAGAREAEQRVVNA